MTEKFPDIHGKPLPGKELPGKEFQPRNGANGIGLPLILLVVAVGAGGVLVLGVVAMGFLSYRPVAMIPDRVAMVQEAAAHSRNIQARNSLSTTSSVRHRTGGGVACGRVIVLNESNHPLMAHVGPLVRQILQADPQFASVEYLSAGQTPVVGSAGADIFVRLWHKDIRDSGTRNALQIDATIGAFVGSQLADGHVHEVTPVSPPRVDFSTNMTLQHHSKTERIPSSDQRFAAAADNIAQQLAEAIAKHVRQLVEKDGVLPELAPQFRPAYRPVPETLDVASLGAELVASHSTLMAHNETYWRLPPQNTPLDTMKVIAERFASVGWKTSDIPDKFTRWTQLSLRNGEDRLDVFSVDSSAADAPHPLWIRYVDRMNKEELSAAVTLLVASRVPVETILPWHRSLSADQRIALIERLEKEPPQSPGGWLALAHYYHGTKQEQQAISALQKAYLLAQLEHHSDRMEAIRDLAKKWKVKDFSRTTRISPEALRSLPIEELSFDSSEHRIQRQLTVGVPLHLFSVQPNGEWSVWTIKVANSGNRRNLHVGRTRNGSSSWGTQSWNGNREHRFVNDLGSGRLQFTLSALADDNTAQLEVEFQEKNVESADEPGETSSSTTTE